MGRAGDSKGFVATCVRIRCSQTQLLSASRARIPGSRIELEFLAVSEVSVASLKNEKSGRPCSYSSLHSL